MDSAFFFFFFDMVDNGTFIFLCMATNWPGKFLAPLLNIGNEEFASKFPWQDGSENMDTFLLFFFFNFLILKMPFKFLERSS